MVERNLCVVPRFMEVAPLQLVAWLQSLWWKSAVSVLVPATLSWFGDKLFCVRSLAKNVGNFTQHGSAFISYVT